MTAAQDAQRAREKAAAAPRVEAIRKLAAAGMSGPQIAGELGMTRGQVMGLCHRNEIRLGAARIVEPPAPVPKPVAAIGGKGCRFPLWPHKERPDGRFCGERVARGSYCTLHDKVTHYVSNISGGHER